MTYKSLFTVLTNASLVASTLEQAVAIAAAHDAHLDVLCLGVDRSQAGYYYAGASAMVLEQTITMAKAEAEAIEAAARKQLGKTDIRWGCDTDIAQIVELTRHVAARARFSDLVVLPQPYGEGRGAELEAVTEACLFEGNTPVVVVPRSGGVDPHPDRILIGWNDSIEALNAVRAALPLLRAAEAVHVVVVDPPVRGPNRSDPGGLLSQYLSRHGVRVAIDVLAKSMPRVSDILLRHATDMNANLVVMGAYSHSRFREAVFGGATRYMLEEAGLPVFMAH